jgi:hypothetical protein
MHGVRITKTHSEVGENGNFTNHALQENIIHSLGFLNSSVLTNIFKLYSSVPTDEYKLIFIGFDWAPTNI